LPIEKDDKKCKKLWESPKKENEEKEQTEEICLKAEVDDLKTQLASKDNDFKVDSCVLNNSKKYLQELLHNLDQMKKSNKSNKRQIMNEARKKEEIKSQLNEANEKILYLENITKAWYKLKLK
jgi:hypothetical protein